MRQHLSETEQTIQKLKQDLWLTRNQILHLAPQQYSYILRNYTVLDASKNIYQWLDHISEEILETTQLIEKYKNSYSPRAYCPLCGHGSQSAYAEGFAFPEGLRRHLVGFGNTNQCVFTETAFQLAIDHWHEKFAEVEQKERIEKQQHLEQRKLTETLYKISPYDNGYLIDESLWHEARNSQQLKWAIQRLNDLGFVQHQEKNTISWIDEHENWIVYADIRQNGRIEFIVWKKPLCKKKPSDTYKHRISQFHLLDTWKNDLKSKYNLRLPKS